MARMQANTCKRQCLNTFDFMKTLSLESVVADSLHYERTYRVIHQKD